MAICFAVKRGLTLGQQENTRHELEPCSDGGQMAEEHQDLVEDVLVRVRRTRKAAERSGAEPFGRGTEHVVVGHQVAEARVLNCACESPDEFRIRPAIRLGKHCADPHRVAPLVNARASAFLSRRRDQSLNSHGLTTLRNRHVEGSGARLRFRFRGKSGRFRETVMSDSRLARIIRRCQEIPGRGQKPAASQVHAAVFTEPRRG